MPPWCRRVSPQPGGLGHASLLALDVFFRYLMARQGRGGSLIVVHRSRILAWGSVGALALLVAGAAWLGVLTQSASASAQLAEAYSATNNASSFIVTASSDPSEQSVFSGPNLYETIVDGRVTSIWVGHTIYQAVPASCSTKAKFIKTHPQGFATAKFVGFAGDSVTEAGETFTVSRKGREIGRYLVRGGYVVKMTQMFNAGPGSKVVAETESFSDIGHAPRIVIPTASESIVSPQLYLRGCPL